MPNRVRDIRVLANTICDEVQSCLPSEFDQDTAKNVLFDKIESLLSERESQISPPESRRVTILLSDIRGFTALAEQLSAMTIVEMLNRYFSCMTKVIVKYNGTIDKLMGDSIMVLFGVPHSNVDDVQSAIACAVEMQHEMSAFNEQNIARGLPELYIGIGINTGDVVAGEVGCAYHREYTVIGDEVNLVSRIEAQCLRGQILISENTYQLAKNFVTVDGPNRVHVKGKQDLVAFYELRSVTAPRVMTVPKREMRKCPRVVVSMPCVFQQIDGKTVLPKRYCAEVKDIGYNGLKMSCPVEMRPFTEIKMAVSLGLLGNTTSDIYARVVNVNLAGEEKLYSVEFTYTDEAGQQAIKRFVDELIPVS